MTDEQIAEMEKAYDEACFGKMEPTMALTPEGIYVRDELTGEVEFYEWTDD